jgi:negative regulator of flagellin synthesis FlgM
LKIDQTTTGSATSLRLAPKARTSSAAAPLPGDALQAGANVRQLPGPSDGTFDAARVAAIREDIRAGRYQINPERIADGMIASLRELLPAAKP